MKRVRIYEPEITKEIKGKETVYKIVNKKARFLNERSVMDRTLNYFKDGGDDLIIQQNQYMEEVSFEEIEEGLLAKSREELVEEAKKHGVKVDDSNKDETIIKGILKKKKLGFKI